MRYGCRGVKNRATDFAASLIDMPGPSGKSSLSSMLIPDLCCINNTPGWMRFEETVNSGEGGALIDVALSKVNASRYNRRRLRAVH